MKQHAVIMKVIDAWPALRPEAHKGDGLCFGMSLVIAHALHAGKLKEVEQQIEDIVTTFSPFKSESMISQTISEWKNDPLKVPHLILLRRIAIAQSARHYRTACSIPIPPNTSQHESVDGVLTYFERSVPALAPQAPPRKASMVVVYCDEKTLSTLLKGINVETAQVPIAFLFSYMGHTVSLGYDNIRKTWVFSDINNTKIVTHKATRDEITALAWDSLRDLRNGSRAVSIMPIITLNSQLNGPYKKAVGDFMTAELEKIPSYRHSTENILLELYVTSKSHRVQSNLRVLQQHRYIDCSKSFQHNFNILNTENYSLIELIETSQDDLALGVIWNGAKSELKKRNARNETALHRAIRLNKQYLAEKIADQPDTDLTAQDDEGYTPCMLAIQQNHPKILQKIITPSYANHIINSRVKSQGIRVQDLAAHHNNIEAIRLLATLNIIVMPKPAEKAALPPHPHDPDPMVLYTAAIILGLSIGLMAADLIIGKFKYNH